jgi:hypothetical protein
MLPYTAARSDRAGRSVRLVLFKQAGGADHVEGRFGKPNSFSCKIQNYIKGLRDFYGGHTLPAICPSLT